MLVVKNEDKPGMIGQIGTLLGGAQVNIANMQVSRNQENASAMMLMTVDNAVSKDVLKMLTGFAGITAAYFVKM